jgi:hypothetical protein
VKDLLRSTHLNKFTGTHDCNPRRQLSHDRKAVRDEDVGQAELALKILQQEQHLGANGYVQCGDRFIRNEQLGPQDQRASNSEALTLAAGKFVRITP